MLPEGQCVAVGCDKEIILRLGECLTGNISCDPDGNATIDIGINFACICEVRCPWRWRDRMRTSASCKPSMTGAHDDQ